MADFARKTVSKTTVRDLTRDACCGRDIPNERDSIVMQSHIAASCRTRGF